MANISDTQPIRRSSFIFTYGPGAVIETKNGPRLIPSMKNGLKYYWDTNMLDRFEISDVRLCQYLAKSTESADKCRIFALPSNAELGLPENKAVYVTRIFPEWQICYNLQGHKHPVLHKEGKCPVCGRSDKNSAVRFVAACPEGHLDEIDWSYAVHHERSGCSSKVFDWIASGSSLASIRIRCRSCNKETTMQDIYRMAHKCSSRIPEKEMLSDKNGASSVYGQPERNYDKCDKKMKVVQRQSVSLRIADIVTLLTIPKYDDDFSRILQQRSLKLILETTIALCPKDNDLTADTLIGRIHSLPNISSESKSTIIEAIKIDGLDAFLNKLNGSDEIQHSFIDMINEEFRSLLNENGKTGSVNFRMGKLHPLPKTTQLIPELMIGRVNKIRTVTVQRGYRRLMNNQEISPSKMISIAEKNGEMFWFPGFEGFGEGIFIHCNNNSLNDIPHGAAYKSWSNFTPDKTQINSDWLEVCSIPEFVWMHTLSHALIRSISEFTGYSVASIRERVYYDKKMNEGGILIYNTTPGDDGGMGGLTDIVDSFQKIMKRAEELIMICSNDPLCHDVKREGKMVNGSACYGCLLISETSCEHGNKWLDRHIFLDGTE
ncbi:DUF1998 domain-containing protein [Methanocorpusculum bavaricum]|uniref:DUF1998 domain-containing protein n=1 Tax=Methanocorpusculum bavaricum TaxID=71518 RepID=UPI0005B2666D|nr:DUF1998 domain-containing protein [Methanocorpusculum bavaricum]